MQNTSVHASKNATTTKNNSEFKYKIEIACVSASVSFLFYYFFVLVVLFLLAGTDNTIHLFIVILYITIASMCLIV